MKIKVQSIFYKINFVVLLLMANTVTYAQSGNNFSSNFSNSIVSGVFWIVSIVAIVLIVWNFIKFLQSKKTGFIKQIVWIVVVWIVIFIVLNLVENFLL